MTVSETLAALKTKKGIVPSADYTGTEKADDFIFAIQTDASAQTKESDWIVFAERVKEHSGAMNASTEDVPYIRAGTVTEKGEKGEAAFIVTADASGSASNSAGFACDVKGVGVPAEFNYLTVAAG